MIDEHGFSLTMELQDGYRVLVDFDPDGVAPLLIVEPEPSSEPHALGAALEDEPEVAP